MSSPKNQQKRLEKPKYIGKPYLIHEVGCICDNPFSGIAQSAEDYAFEVFQLVNEEGQPQPSIYECDNCARVWRVNDVGDAELVDMTAPTMYRRKMLDHKLPGPLRQLFDEMGASSAKRAWAVWVHENENWGDSLVLGARDDRSHSDKLVYKLIQIHGPGDYKVLDLSANKSVVVFD